MKRIQLRTRVATFIMVVSMSVYTLGGFGGFCANKSLCDPCLKGVNPSTIGVVDSGKKMGTVPGQERVHGNGLGGTFPRCLGLMKMRPMIPRGTAAYNRTRGYVEARFDARSLRFESGAAMLTDHGCASKGARLITEPELRWPFFRSDPLAVTTVLLI